MVGLSFKAITPLYYCRKVMLVAGETSQPSTISLILIRPHAEKIERKHLRLSVLQLPCCTLLALSMTLFGLRYDVIEE
jgi:hypothetical protein